MWRKLFNYFHNTKPEERQKIPPDFPLQLVRRSSEMQQIVLAKNSGSSQEPLITPKESDTIETEEERLEKTEIFSPSHVIEIEMESQETETTTATIISEK